MQHTVQEAALTGDSLLFYFRIMASINVAVGG